MIMLWMLYAATVAIGVGAIAVIAEHLLYAVRLPARWVWVLAMVVALVFSATGSRQAASRGERAATSKARIDAAIPSVVPKSSSQVASNQMRGALPPVQVSRAPTERSWKLPFHVTRPTIGVAADSFVGKLDHPFIALWAVGCAFVLFGLGGALWRLRKVLRRAKVDMLDGISVLVTPNTGPLALGLWSPRILVPEWLYELPADERQLVLAHEQEHVRAKDPAVLTLGLVLVGLMPWNPALWYMWRRLRRAVELDCDRRVLRIYPNRRAYAELLLFVAGRWQPRSLPVPTLASTPSFLQRRLRLMTNRPPRFLAYRLASGLVAAGLIVGLTAMVPRPIVTPISALHPAHLSPSATDPKPTVTAHIRLWASDSTGAHLSKVVHVNLALIPQRASGALDTGNTTLVQLTTPSDLTLDLTRTTAHFSCADGCTLHMEATIDRAPSSSISATGPEMTINAGGVFDWAPDVVADKTTPDDLEARRTADARRLATMAAQLEAVAKASSLAASGSSAQADLIEQARARAAADSVGSRDANVDSALVQKKALLAKVDQLEALAMATKAQRLEEQTAKVDQLADSVRGLRERQSEVAIENAKKQAALLEAWDKTKQPGDTGQAAEREIEKAKQNAVLWSTLSKTKQPGDTGQAAEQEVEKAKQNAVLWSTFGKAKPFGGGDSGQVFRKGFSGDSSQAFAKGLSGFSSAAGAQDAPFGGSSLRTKGFAIDSATLNNVQKSQLYELKKDQSLEWQRDQLLAQLNKTKALTDDARAVEKEALEKQLRETAAQLEALAKQLQELNASGTTK